MSTEEDLYSTARDYAPAQVQIGTVGWDDRDDHFDAGTEDNDGHTLVYVTLYAGRTQGSPVLKGVAQGHKIICHIADGAFRIPPKGSRCYVIIPAGMEEVTGAGVIVACVSPSSSRDQFAADRVVLDYGDDVHVVIRGKSVSLQDPDSRFLTVGTPRAGGDPGIWLQAADGSGGAIADGKVGFWASDGTDAQTILQMTTTEVKCMKKDGGFWSVDTDGFMGFGTTASLKAAAVYLGSVPTPLTGVQMSSTPGAMSAGVFASPT
jgi:hypothetical protein